MAFNLSFMAMITNVQNLWIHFHKWENISIGINILEKENIQHPSYAKTYFLDVDTYK